MDERRVAEQLAKIGDALARAVPQMPERLTPEVVLAEIERNGEDPEARTRHGKRPADLAREASPMTVVDSAAWKAAGGASQRP